MKQPVRLCLRLLGRFALAGESKSADTIRLSTRKAAALIAYLAMKDDFTATREELATLLWGSCSDPQARQSLRQALASLRKELQGSELLFADNETVRLQPEFWSVDAREFDELTKSANPEDLDRAGRLFGGEFLSGLNSISEEGFEEWLRNQRRRMQVAAGRLCETYAACPELVQDGEQAIAAVERLLVLDPLREDYQRAALTLYARYHGKLEALANAEAFGAVLERELGVAPEKETRALIEQIRAGRITPAAVAAQNAPKASPTVRESESSAAAQAAVPNAHGKQLTAAAPPLPPSISPWSARWFAAGLVMAALAIAVGFWGVSHFRATAVHSLGSLAAAESDPSPLVTSLWQSPTLPGSAAADLGEVKKGLVPIVVLPFKVFGDPSGPTELLADMVTDDLTNLLSCVPFIRVISRQTALTYKGQPIDVAVLAAELHVKYVLEGSMRMHDGKLRLNLDLIDPTTRLPVWTTRIERTGADRYDVQDEIVGRLARELQFGIIPIESARRSNDHDVQALTYRGWAALTRVNLEDYKQAKIYFEQALEREPQNLSAQIGIGAYHARMGVQVLDTEPIAHRAKARDILQDAVRRDPKSSVAYFYLGLSLNLLPTVREAIDYFERSIELDPSNASAYGQIGNALIRSGRPVEGLEHVRYAMRLSPHDPIMAVWQEFAGNGELELGHYPEAIEYFHHAVLLNPSYPRSWAGLAAAHALAGNEADSRGFAEKLRTFQPDMSTKSLVNQFGRSKTSRLYQGLELALAQPADR